MLATLALLGAAQAAQFDLTMGLGLVGYAPMMTVAPEVRFGPLGASLELGALPTPFVAAGDASAGVRYWAVPRGTVRGWAGLRAGTGGMAAIGALGTSWQHADLLLGVRVGRDGGSLAFDARGGMSALLVHTYAQGNPQMPVDELRPTPTLQLGLTVTPHRSFSAREARADVRVRPDPVVEAVRGGLDLETARARIDELEEQRSRQSLEYYGVDWDYLASMGGEQVRAQEAAALAALQQTNEELRELRKVARLLGREA